MDDTVNREDIRRYLLGLLDLTKQEELEQRLLTDEAFLDEVLIAEDKLVDDFLRNKLSPDEQTSFSGYFLTTPDRKEKLRFAGTFKRYVDSTPSAASSNERQLDSRPSGFQSFMASLRLPSMATAFSLAAVLFFAVLAGLLGVRQQVLQAELNKLKAERGQAVESPDLPKGNEAQPNVSVEQLTPIEANQVRTQQKREDLERQIARLEAQKRAATTDRPKPRTSFQTPILAMGAVRSGDNGGLPEIKVPDGYSIINIALGLPGGEDGTYRAILLNADAKVLYSKSNLRPQEVSGQRVVLLGVPAEKLLPGEYRIRLIRATGDRKVLGSYSIRVS